MVHFSKKSIDIVRCVAATKKETLNFSFNAKKQFLRARYKEGN